MSCSIKGFDIDMTRGDALTVRMPLYLDGKEYVLQEGDVVRFAARDPDGADVLIEKDISNDYVLELESVDTKSLDLGTYRYDVQITFGDTGKPLTYIPDTPKGKAKLTLTWEAK